MNRKATHINRYFFIVCMVGCLLIFSTIVRAQDTTSITNTTPTVDLGDFARKILHKEKDSSAIPKTPKIAILPSFGYNPSLGAVIGAKASGVKQLGDPGTTNLSSFGLEALLSSKGVITVQARHNIYKKANKWVLKGNWQFSRFLILDYGIGTGNKDYQTKSDSTFPLRFNYLRLTQRIYRKIGKNLYAGAGLSFNIRTNIDDKKLETLPSSPHSRYSHRNGFDSTRYSVNGFLLGIEHNTRDHPFRSYKGDYFEFVLRYNPTWMGSSRQSTQLYYDYRKYLGVSKKNPEHIVAFWFIASFRLGGTIPYLELPATGYDLYNRSGRGYTIGRFKGPSYAYYETEYRFPITANKLLSGVLFFNITTASDDLGKKLFKFWEPATGAGLRILLQKQSRTTICLDYARGKYGSSGIFFGLNEAF